MTKRLQSIIKSKGPAAAAILLLLGVWQGICTLQLVEGYLLPSPAEVVGALISERALLWEHALITLQEAFLGLFFGVSLGLLLAVAMDSVPLLRRAFYPILVMSQTVPTVAIAPLLVLWFGYDMLPKILLIILTTFFPVTVGVMEGFHAADKDAMGLLRSMGAGWWQIFWHIKAPFALPQFFASLRIAVAYSVVGAVISEWLGGFGGLGVYMTRVKGAFAFDKMFAVILVICVVSLLLMGAVSRLERWVMPYRHVKEKK